MSSPFMGFSIQHGKGAVLKGHIRLGPVCVLGSGVPHFPIPHSFQVLLEKEINIANKLVCWWEHEVLRNPLVAALTLDLIKRGFPNHHRECEHTGLLLVSAFPSDSRTFNFFFSFFFNLKRGFGPHCQVSHLPRDCGCRYRISPREAGLLKFFLSFLYVFCFLHLFDCTVERIQVSWKEKHGDQVQEIASE